MIKTPGIRHAPQRQKSSEPWSFLSMMLLLIYNRAAAAAHSDVGAQGSSTCCAHVARKSFGSNLHAASADGSFSFTHTGRSFGIASRSVLGTLCFMQQGRAAGICRSLAAIREREVHHGRRTSERSASQLRQPSCRTKGRRARPGGGRMVISPNKAQVQEMRPYLHIFAGNEMSELPEHRNRNDQPLCLNWERVRSG